jgi:hypothetical protein
MAAAPTSFTISCEDCTMRATPACDDCVVTFLCDREPDDAVTIDLAEERAVRLLADVGLVPRLRHDARRSGS